MHPLSRRWRSIAAAVPALLLAACGRDTPVSPDQQRAARDILVEGGLAYNIVGDVQLQVGQQTLIKTSNSRVMRTPAWTSSNPTVATVNGAGAVTAVSPGETFVSVTGFATNQTFRVGVAPAPSITAVTLAPQTGTALAPGQTRQFSTAVTWSDGATRAATLTYSATGGTISNTGLFTAGPLAGAFAVIVSCGSCGVADTVAGTVASLSSLTISPKTVTVAPSATQQFTASASWSNGATMMPGVVFSVPSSTHGTVTATGQYTAPTTAGTYRVILAQVGGDLRDTATITVSAPAPQLASLSISPKSLTLAAGATQQFTASASWSTGATTLPPVNYSMVGGGTAVTSTGFFTAPLTAGTYRVVVAHTGGTLRDTATVTVTAPQAPTGATGSWQLGPGRFVAAKMPMHVTYPRPDAETPTWARHRRAYPGLQYRIPVAVQGGAYPFHYQVISGPPGMTIGASVWDQNYGVITWTPGSTGGPFAVSVRVTDQQGATINATFSVTATTQGFVFINAAAAPGGTGTIGSPLRSFTDVLKGSSTDRSYAGHILYFRGGVHNVTGLAANSGNVNLVADNKPMAWLGYPGENVTLDASSAAVNFTDGTSGHDFFAQGFLVRNSRPDVANSRFFFFGGGSGNRATFFDVRFAGLVRGTVGNDNPGAIVMFKGVQFRQYLTVINCRIDDYAAPLVGSIYTTRYGVIDGNVLGDGGRASVNQGIYVKEGNDLFSVRRNTSVQQDFGEGAIQSQFFATALSVQRIEIAYNLLRTPSPTAVAIRYNWGTSAVPGSTVWVYRNTLLGRVQALSADYTGILENNFVYNNDSPVWMRWGTPQGQGFNNVTGTSSASSGILDGSFRLFGTARTQHVGRVGHEIAN